MSNHFSADYLRFPGDDTRLDLTDVYAFRSTEDPGKTVLIIDSNPTVRPPIELPPTVITSRDFHPGAVYRINVDTDGDAQADVAFTFTFSELDNGAQTATVYYATGAQAREPGPVGQVLTSSLPVSFDAMAKPVQVEGIRLFAGARSEPFFADVEGALHGFAWTGHDDFAGNSVLSIALEVPDDLLGAGPVIGVWASISLRRDGVLTQMDRGGNPTSRTPGSQPTTWPTTWDRGPRYWKTTVTHPTRPGRKPTRCCPTSCVTTAPGPPPTPTAAPPPTTSTACASPGSATAKSLRPASSPTTTCSTNSPISASPTPNGQGRHRRSAHRLCD